MNGILLVNKPIGMTSHDVVSKVRRILKTKKIGHSGTLDPLASGVLVLGVNKGTKLLQFLSSDSKVYIATLSLGVATDTYDVEGSITKEKQYKKDISESMVEEVLQNFLGKQQQTPPIYSAIKVNGKKLYEYARNKEEVKIEPREIEIFQLSLLSFVEDTITFHVECSKGTYIRSLCVDIAEKLNYPGHMSALVRDRAGEFSLEQCYSLEDIEQGNYQLLPMNKALLSMPSLIVEDESIVYHGKLIRSSVNERVAIYNKEKTLLAVYEPNGAGYLKTVRGLW